MLSIFILMSVVYCEASYASSEGVSHYWTEVLKENTHQGRVNYKSIKANGAQLKASIQSIETITKFDFDSLDVKQKMAFWINVYNVGVVKVIIDNYPIKRSFGLKAVRYPANSIQQIENVWDRPILTVRSRELSLNDIENKILRPEFKDPRIHFAIVCASISCPVIRSEAYTAKELDQQLSEQIEIFLDDPSKVRYDKNKDILYLSPIFKWFKEDFDQVGGTIAFIKKHSSNHMFDSVTQQTQIQWLGYDWNLNEGY
jgi:hypothetical protein